MIVIMQDQHLANSMNSYPFFFLLQIYVKISQYVNVCWLTIPDLEIQQLEFGKLLMDLVTLVCKMNQ